MTQRMGGSRRKTRSKLKKNVRNRTKISLSKYFQKFKEGERVILKAEPAVQKGMYLPRFHGATGTITGSQGACYLIKIKDKNKEKILLVHPVHLKRSN
ncbi:MAG: 50S ribosomal protein L21e [Nanoarchaeota archaeon]|nr:50S ribosomal protein L21e [Nanoarchaeota archaeon]